ncbi:sodium:calcium antiporter [Sphingobacteriales bacterium UPWRP_1]|nr:sodium:proton exchanger [Sphingobacteriales bacterium TSM_CSS]PSJ77673.1 sodium:calcium antiporter [Sphingobacteriales bacterium UPWRP_1]
MFISIVLLIAGFGMLIKGANWLVSGAASLAKRYNIPELVIGLTIVAFGTSTPEMVVNVLASLKGANDIALGNIIGSNNFNTYVILGVAGIIYPLSVKRNTVWREIPYSFLSGLVLLLIANDVFVNQSTPNRIDRTDGVMLLMFFMAFLYYAYLSTKTDNVTANEEIELLGKKKSVLLTIAGLIVLVLGGKIVVDSAVQIATQLQLSQKLIGLTIVAAGTSLPELVTSAVAASKKRSDIAVGNVVGSNIFNLFFVLGLSAFIHPIEYHTAFNTDCLLFLVGNVLLFGTMFIGRRHILDRWQAAALLLVFVGYTVYLITNA